MSPERPTMKSTPADVNQILAEICLLYTSDAADERSSVDLGGRRIIKKKKKASLSTVSGAEEDLRQDHSTPNESRTNNRQQKTNR